MIKVAIIGAGKIAQGYDRPHGVETLSHVKAFQEHGAFEVIAFCDSNLMAAQDAAMHWNVSQAVARVDDVRHVAPDVVCICTPDATHADILHSCIGLSPRLVLCEKPLTTEFSSAKALVERYQSARILLAVNYSRRWLNILREWQQAVSSGSYGSIRSIRARYYGGWFHIGSHLVDLIQFLFDPAVVGGLLLRKEPLPDDDLRLTGTAVLQAGECTFPFHFECFDGSVAHFEMEMVFENCSLWLSNRNGMVYKFCPVMENALYPGYFELSEGAVLKVEASEAMRGLVKNIYACLSGNEELLSTGASALKTLDICEAIGRLSLPMETIL